MTIKETARQAALGEWYAWKERAPDPADKMTHALADAVAVAVLREIQQRQAQPVYGGGTLHVIDVALAEFTPAPVTPEPPRECPLCHELVAEVVKCAESSRGRCPMRKPASEARPTTEEEAAVLQRVEAGICGCVLTGGVLTCRQLGYGAGSLCSQCLAKEAVKGMLSRAQVESALKHTSRAETERILERLGYTAQEITDAIR